MASSPFAIVAAAGLLSSSPPGLLFWPLSPAALKFSPGKVKGGGAGEKKSRQPFYSRGRGKGGVLCILVRLFSTSLLIL